MPVTEFRRTTGDGEFVSVVLEFIRGAERDIGVIAGELSAYNFPELKDAAHQAAGRGAHISVYANSPDDDVVREIRQDRGRLKIGSIKSRHHYLVVDGKHVVVSLKPEDAGPTVRGSREGRIYRDEPEMATAVKSYLRFLDDTATGVDTSEVLGELLRESLRHPVLAREIPFAENVLSVSGMDVAGAKRTVDQLRRRFSTWLEPTESPEKEAKLLDAIVNGVALMVAISKDYDLRDLPEPWDLRSLVTDVHSSPASGRRAG